MKIFTYIFQHKRYKKVQALYKEAISELESAYRVWAEYQNLPGGKKFEEKEFIAKHIFEIREIAAWVKIYADILKNKKDGLIWLYNKTEKSFVREMHYADYKFIVDHAKEIDILQSYMDTYIRYIGTQKEAVERFLSPSSHPYSYDEIRKVALNGEKITDITSILIKAHSLENKYSLAWKYFSKGRSFDEIPLCELSTIVDDDFYIKDSFLKLYAKDSNLIMLVVGKSALLPIYSFGKENIEQERDIIKQLSLRDISPIDNFYADVSLDNEAELKRAILDSIEYGKKCNFVDSFTISDFYKYRADFDEIGVPFDEAVNIEKKNLDAIKAYNKAKYGKAVAFISDYYDIVKEGSDLNLYVDKFNQEQNLRYEAKCIQQANVEGFAFLFGTVDVENCELSIIIKIIDSKEKIQIKNNELEEIERQQQEIKNLKLCVCSWPIPNYSSLNCFSLYYYYPVNCGWNVSPEDWGIRYLIWDFKANPNKPQTSSEIIARHEMAMNKVIPLIKRVLEHYFGTYVSKLTLVCIPSSKRTVTERRYKDFSVKLCSMTGLTNGYDYVDIENEGSAKHLGGSVQAEFKVDNVFFKNRLVVLFDDVITSGRSMENFKYLLERVGATVIAGLSIGKTKHEPQNSHPIYGI